MEKIKSNKGITLIELSAYIIVLLLIVGVLASIRNFFFNNLDIVKKASRYAAAFDKFNSYFVQDVKNNKYVNVEKDNNSENVIITFENGDTYIYNKADEGIYKGKVKIATNVTLFNANKKTIMVSGVAKDIISVTIAIGTSSNEMFYKTIDYTLKYW